MTNLGKSASTINEAYYGISWAHKLAGDLDPCRSDLVISVKEGGNRSVGRLTVKKEPITPAILRRLYIAWLYDSEQADLKGIRIDCMCLLCYAGFLRYSELANLKRNNIYFCDNYVKLFLENSKTDIYREGREVLISKPNSPICPVGMLQSCLTLANIDDSRVEYIFRPLCYCKSRNTSIYTTTRETLLSALDTLGLQKKTFGLHSLRSGRATAAAAAARG